jgi:hypothetical protein
MCPVETSFLHQEDLCSAGKSEDNGMTAIECIVEDLFIWLSKIFRLVGCILLDSHFTLIDTALFNSLLHRRPYPNSLETEMFSSSQGLGLECLHICSCAGSWFA